MAKKTNLTVAKKQSKNATSSLNSKIETNAIFCIVNRGFTDLVMVAARNVGAGGGTVLTARGTGSKEFEKYYGIAVSPEKEIVIIVVRKSMTDKVLLAINKEAGLDSAGQGIAFALPVSDYLGINLENRVQNN